MNELSNKLEDLSHTIKDYVQTRYDLVVLEGCEKASDILSEMIAHFIITVVLLITVLLLSIGLAFYISHINGDTYSGLFIVGGFYLVISIVAISLRKAMLTKPFRNRIIGKMFTKIRENENA